MQYELISDEDYANLPDDDEQCFVTVEAVCRRNMTAIINADTSQEFDYHIREQYMSAISAVANECGIPNLEYSSFSQGNFNDRYNRFLFAVQAEIARIRIRGRRNNQSSVRLESNTRTKIEHYISRIRHAIDASDLTEARKSRLYDQLDQLIAELGKPRLNLGKTMLILGLVMAAINPASSVITIAADAPDAITNIVKLIGLDKESEQAAELRLSPPRKALPSPVAKPAVNEELDDDIPF